VIFVTANAYATATAARNAAGSYVLMIVGDVATAMKFQSAPAAVGARYVMKKKMVYIVPNAIIAIGAKATSGAMIVTIAKTVVYAASA